MTTSLLLIGLGNMGRALLERWQASGIAQFAVIDPNVKNAGVACYADLAALPASFKADIIVFAVKPQQLAETLPAYRERFGITPLYISIAAGKSLSFFTGHLGAQARVVRTMPNTPAMVGEGMTALCAAATIQPADKAMAETLMAAVGKTVWIDDESQMDAVTALSGSGPAYVFLFLDALVKAGVAAGLSQSAAHSLAMQTLYGSLALARESDKTLDELRRNVTSPGGTTEAALRVLMQGDALEKLVGDAVAAAAKRSRELAE